MAPEPPRRIFLTGFSFSGKSQVAPLVAQSLGWRALDLDDLIEEGAGRPIPRYSLKRASPASANASDRPCAKPAGKTKW